MMSWWLHAFAYVTMFAAGMLAYDAVHDLIRRWQRR